MAPINIWGEKSSGEKALATAIIPLMVEVTKQTLIIREVCLCT